MTATVVDVRPDRFLRVVRDTGDWNTACEKSGMTTAEVSQLCRENAKFDLSIVECQLEYCEERIVSATERVIEVARAQRADRLKMLREQAMAEFYARHSETAHG